MKIVNIDAPRHLAEKVVYLRIPWFVTDVMQTLERDFYERHSEDDLYEIEDQIIIGCYHNPFPPSPIWEFWEACYENITALIHTIPIYLRDSRPKCGDNCIIDPLGAYYSSRSGNSPYIELYLTAIENSVHNNDNHFKWLLTKVLIHELAHAALDFFNSEYYNFWNVTEKVSYKTDFGRWREESAANATALRIIKDYGNKDFYDYAKKFMQSQDPEYALGVLMEEIGDIESVFHSVFYPKIFGINPTLQQEWLNYVNNAPDVDGLNKWNDFLSDPYVYVFDGKYYSSSSSGKLVYDIVNKVLSDYENKEGEKMTYNTFSSLFHNIKMGSGMSYEPTQNVTGDDRYKNVINLDDGDFSLRDCWWDNEDLHKFIDFNKLNISIIEYKNW